MRKIIWLLAVVALVASACAAPQPEPTPTVPPPAASPAAPVNTMPGNSEIPTPPPAVQPPAVQPPTAPPPVAATLIGPVWEWLEKMDASGQTTTAAQPANYTLQFKADGTVNVKADCNSGSGPYAVTASSLLFGPIALTLMGCPPGSQDTIFTASLQDVRGYTINNNELTLTLKDNGGSLKFRPAGGATALPVVSGGVVAPATDQAAAAAAGIDFSALGGNVEIKQVPATPYDNSKPPAPQGMPAHVAIYFEGEEIGYILPIQEYLALFLQANDQTVQQIFAGFQQIMAARQNNPTAAGQAPAPILPPPGGVNDLVCQFKYLDFNGGSGYRFIGRTAQDVSPVTSAQLRYYFQGLTADGQYYVSVIMPVAAKFVPDTAGDMPADYDKYIADLTGQCNAASDADVTPPLNVLDQIMQGINIAGVAGIAPGNAPGASQPPAGSNDIVGPTWKMQSITGPTGTSIPVPTPDTYTLQLQPDGMATLRADCNQAGASYEISGNLIRFELGPATLAACPPGSLDTLFLQAIDSAASFAVRGGQLLLTLEDGSIVTFNQ